MNYYVLYRLADGAAVRTGGFDQDRWTSGELRIDPSSGIGTWSGPYGMPGLNSPRGVALSGLLGAGRVEPRARGAPAGGQRRGSP